jgi:hypothetical protein
MSKKKHGSGIILDQPGSPLSKIKKLTPWQDNWFVSVIRDARFLSLIVTDKSNCSIANSKGIKPFQQLVLLRQPAVIMPFVRY